jgi:hypothetical protein
LWHIIEAFRKVFKKRTLLFDQNIPFIFSIFNPSDFALLLFFHFFEEKSHPSGDGKAEN